MNEQIKILYVEDNADILRLTGRLLGSRGYAVTTAATIAAARENLSAMPPDLILLDGHLPDGNGIDFLRELRKTSGVPVIMAAGLSWAEESEAFEAGCNDYIGKPFLMDDLVARMEKLLCKESREAPNPLPG